MNKIIVTYDLCGFDKDYNGLITRLKEYPVCLKLNKSSWLINTSFECAEVRDQLLKHLDSDDSLFVAELTGTAAWKKVESNSDDVKKAL